VGTGTRQTRGKGMEMGMYGAGQTRGLGLYRRSRQADKIEQFYPVRYRTLPVDIVGVRLHCTGGYAENIADLLPALTLSQQPQDIGFTLADLVVTDKVVRNIMIFSQRFSEQPHKNKDIVEAPDKNKQSGKTGFNNKHMGN
jgi:hypothetical protein